MGDAVEEHHGVREFMQPEEYPCQQNQRIDSRYLESGKRPSRQSAQSWKSNGLHKDVPIPLQDQIDTMQESPDDEVVGGTMPEAAQKHRKENVSILAQAAMTVAAQRYVEVVAQERRQRYMPAPPEF